MRSRPSPERDHLEPAARSRRGFFGLFGAGAGVALASGVVVPSWLAGCGGKDEAGGAAAVAGGSTTGGDKADAEAHDAKLLNQGIALEQGAINVYKAAAGLPFIASDATILGVASLFMGQHEEHRDALIRWVGQLGGEALDPATAPTPEIPAAILDDTLADDVRKTAALEFARALEKQAADAYFGLITANLLTDFARRSAAEILPVEAQHVAVYDLVLQRAKPVGAALFSEQP